jgi:UPF0176 protein|tara:strand:+ start:1153 stop:2121 length:969 start_codon:yes stop_codon:yes gene_type:complete
MSFKYQILLFYCYTKINNPEKFRDYHHLFCIENNIRGRIIISQEGINGTVSGKIQDCNKYMNILKMNQLFKNLEFKVDNYNSNAFQKLHVRLKSEIVNSGIKDIDVINKSGKYIQPGEFKEILNNKPKDTFILDVRSNYEHEIGKFKNAITLDLENFRFFSDKIEEIEKKIDKSKKIITYCTGGIKCEKASALLISKGYKNVYQLHGGIIKYGIEEDGENFHGKCYVFDNRIVKNINKINPTVISECLVTREKTDRMVNCANADCNKHFTLSEKGAEKFNGCCSKKCMISPNIRKYDGTGFYQRKMNGYNPLIGSKNKSRIN